uniref:calycin-like domain-containing protein n=1 Tax=Candidatus Limisoma sp. TaxID=3076476 RepID=UPI004026FEB4
MKKSFLLSGALLLSISAFTANAQQLPNVGFDSWKTTCGTSRSISKDGKKVDVARPGVEPSEWNGSNVNQMGQKKPDLVTKVVDNSNTVVQVKNIYVGVNLGLIKIGSTAPGFINLGTPWVYASTTISDCDGGVFGGISFDKKPDAIKGKYKRTDSNSEDSHIIAYLWNGTYTSKIGNVAQTVTEEQNNVDRVVLGKATGSASGKLVVSCDKAFSSTANKDWETIVVPLDYLANAGNPTMMNVIISAGDYWNRGNLKENTTLLVDDVDFVYYSTLTSLTVGGETIALQEGVYNYNLKTDMPSVSKEDVVAVCKSQFANADVTIDNVNKQIKIVVTNQGGKDTDGATSHTYTLQYPVETTYQGYLNVKMGYGYLAGNDAHDITITDYNDGTCDFLLPDLTVLMPLGDIEIKNMNVTSDASGLKTYSGVENNKKLMGGDIIANVKVNGTIDAKGTVNMDVDVVWLYGENEIPIKVKFTSSELSETVDGYYFIVKEDKSNTYGWATIKENQPTQLLVYPKSNGEGGADYRLTVKKLVWDGMLNGDFVVEGAAIKEDENSNPIYFVENAPVSFMGGKTASVSVNSGYDMTKEPYEYDMKFNTVVDGTNYIVGFTTNQVSSSVNDVEASGAAVRGAEGSIVVEGFAGRVNVYTVDGRLAASAQVDGEATITVAAGLYVVRAGEKAVKVVVK